MELQITKKTLVDALIKMREISTKGIKTDFAFASQVTIEAQQDKVTFCCSNGHIDARLTVDNEADKAISVSEAGIVSVNVSVALKIAEALGGQDADDHLIAIKLDGKNNLEIRDATSKRRKCATMQIFKDNHPLAFHKPTKGFSYNFEMERLSKGIHSVSKYCSKLGYKIRYQMICLHFLPEDMRFICGDGMRFAVLSFKEKSINHKIKQEGNKFLLPVDQSLILASVISDAKSVEMCYKDQMTCYIKPDNNLELLLKGIPKEDYIAYEKNAFRFDEARAVVDINRTDLLEGASLVGAVRDKELETEGNFHTCQFIAESANDGGLQVHENKYNCDFSCAASFYKIKDISVFKSAYAWLFINELANTTGSVIRFYCTDEKGVMIAKVGDLEEQKDSAGIPLLKETADNSQLLFFFAAIIEEE
jgi:DNA polymerase III sliding clamp (beta) subunit (PCNA family)